MIIAVAPHPLLRVSAFVTTFEQPLGEQSVPGWLSALHDPAAAAPVQSDDALRGAIRDLLRHGGYKPTGRGKPASEYLIRAAGERMLSSINVAVDACNAASLHSGFPISVVDLDRAHEPFLIAVAPPDVKYVFNASGQEIDVTGLLCLEDAQGPCANAVKDAQRTKTSADTSRTLSIVWGCAGYEERLAHATRWYRELLERCGARTEMASLHLN